SRRRHTSSKRDWSSDVCSSDLKEMGWEAVQISALPEGYDPNEVALALKENNLAAAGMHISLDRLQSDLDGVLKEADLYGTKDIRSEERRVGKESRYQVDAHRSQ